MSQTAHPYDIQGLWRHAADRRNLDEFIRWSSRAAFIDEPAPEHVRAVAG